MDRLHFKSAVEIARLIHERKISVAETLEHFLARVAKYNPKLLPAVKNHTEYGGIFLR